MCPQIAPPRPHTASEYTTWTNLTHLSFLSSAQQSSCETHQRLAEFSWLKKIVLRSCGKKYRPQFHHHLANCTSRLLIKVETKIGRLRVLISQNVIPFFLLLPELLLSLRNRNQEIKPAKLLNVEETLASRHKHAVQTWNGSTYTPLNRHLNYVWKGTANDYSNSLEKTYLRQLSQHWPEPL